MNFIHRVACCCNPDPGGPDTGTPVTECPSGDPPPIDTIAISVTVTPKMYCPVVGFDCDPYEWCDPLHSGYPGTSCYGNVPTDPCGYTPVVAASSKIPTPIFSGSWGNATFASGCCSGWDIDAGTQPCPCTSFLECSDVSIVTSPLSAESGSPQFKTYCDNVGFYDVWNSNPSDLQNNLSIAVSDIKCCFSCECPTPTDYCSRITVDVAYTREQYINHYVPVFTFDSCIDVPYTGNISIQLYSVPILYQFAQTATCYFERKITSSQTIKRLSHGAYALREIGTQNPTGYDIGYFGGSYGNPCTGGSATYTQTVYCPTGSELANAGFSITCTVS